ncbi:hypothetical protein DFH09DRAFT_1087872 [Mycena vulgaris]|nr:hypothetical protein DFH09DRAFT_1087872 [Mycena vulgaris]
MLQPQYMAQLKTDNYGNLMVAQGLEKRTLGGDKGGLLKDGKSQKLEVFRAPWIRRRDQSRGFCSKHRISCGPPRNTLLVPPQNPLLRKGGRPRGCGGLQMGVMDEKRETNWVSCSFMNSEPFLRRFHLEAEGQRGWRKKESHGRVMEIRPEMLGQFRQDVESAAGRVV